MQMTQVEGSDGRAAEKRDGGLDDVLCCEVTEGAEIDHSYASEGCF